MSSGRNAGLETLQAARECLMATPTPPILIRPRLTDYHSLLIAQSDLDFAIPFIDEDIPLYVDPFLLWKSPSQQDQALHTSILNAFNHLNYLMKRGQETEAEDILVNVSECAEVGLGHSKRRRGTRIGRAKAKEVLQLFVDIDEYSRHGFLHFEEIQLYVRDIARDRVSDIACSFMKSFLIDFTQQACEDVGIPMEDSAVSTLYDYRTNKLLVDQRVNLPVNPQNRNPIILVPKRWLRFAPWIGFDEYFRSYCPKDDIFNPGERHDPVRVLRYNRNHYDVVKGYVDTKVRQAADCVNDPLFSQIPVSSAKAKMATIRGLKPGRSDGADRKYEVGVGQLLASAFYPQLDFAQEQSRTDEGVLIRDLIFYNNRSVDFLDEIFSDYGTRQIVFELKNVGSLDGSHVAQLNRYMTDSLGRFGVIVTRSEPGRAVMKNTIDLWSGQRRCVIVLTDADLELMVEVYESKQRTPLEVLKKKYIEFRRSCPS